MQTLIAQIEASTNFTLSQVPYGYTWQYRCVDSEDFAAPFESKENAVAHFVIWLCADSDSLMDRVYQKTS
jgi:hypothetical protein